MIVGVAGTGSMGGAHAFRHASIGLPVVIGSRDKQKAKALALKINGQNVKGCTVENMIKKSNFIILAIPPHTLKDFFDTHRDLIVG